jgi:ubiquitin thioesterase protein OTUB1
MGIVDGEVCQPELLVSYDHDLIPAAIAFTYFETLSRLNSNAKVHEEVARIHSLNNLLATAGGFSEYVYEDFVEETQQLLRDITTVANPLSLILDRMNDDSVSNSVVYHLRMLAISWLRANPSLYVDFIPDDIGVDGYCNQYLQPVNQEIDHLGMTLLIDVLLKPIGFAVEIVYLDRSSGSEVNTHRFEALDQSGRPLDISAPTIHLLYRPSHYDVLYKDSASPLVLPSHVKRSPTMLSNSNSPLNAANPGATDVQIHRAAHLSQPTFEETSFSPSDLGTLLTIPGLIPSNHGFASTFSPDFTTGPTFFKPEPMPAANMYTPPVSASLASPVLPLQGRSPISNEASLNTMANGLPLSSPTTEQKFRPSQYQYPHLINQSASSSLSPLSSNGCGSAGIGVGAGVGMVGVNAGLSDEGQPQTSTFRNSHYNTAHYNNPNFQPEEWCPDD